MLEEMLKAGMIDRALQLLARRRTSTTRGPWTTCAIGVREHRGIRCGVLLDTKGPEIRTGMLAHGGPVMLEAGNEIVLTTDYEFKGSAENRSRCRTPDLAKDVKPGSKILCADGSVTFTVLECDVAKGRQVRCRLENSAKLGERKNMNLPGVNVELAHDHREGSPRFDRVGGEEQRRLHRRLVRAQGKRRRVHSLRARPRLREVQSSIISKVENMEGLDNFYDIVEKSDGVMVARGDLGMEIRMEQIFLAQKRMIKRCNYAGKPVVTATQMLESMTGAPRPTRAEATDVANAILDGTDAVMLSGETAAGNYAVEAISVMADICQEAEAYVDNVATFKNLMDHQTFPMSTIESVASSAVRSSHKVSASLIVCLAESGTTARLIAKYRPGCRIVCLCIPYRDGREHDPESVARRLKGNRGVITFASKELLPSPGENLAFCVELAKQAGLCSVGERVVGVHDVDMSPVMKIMTVE